MIIFNQNKINILKRLGKKVAIAYSLIFLGWFAFVVAGGAVAFFSDLEKSAENVLAAGVLDMEVVGNGIFKEEYKYHGQAPAVEIAVSDAGDVPFLHGFSISAVGDLCPYLYIDAVYTGGEEWESVAVPLADFASGVDFAPGTWNIKTYLPKKYKNKKGECSFDAIFRAEQDADGQGYWDQKIIANWIGTGNKIVPLKMMQETLIDTENLPEENTPPQSYQSPEKGNTEEEDVLEEENGDSLKEEITEEIVPSSEENLLPEAPVLDEAEQPSEPDIESADEVAPAEALAGEQANVEPETVEPAPEEPPAAEEINLEAN